MIEVNIKKAELSGEVSGEASVAVILGSAFSRTPPKGLALQAHTLNTPWGSVVIHEVINIHRERPTYLLFRHGLPHQYYPQQLNSRSQIVALKMLNCKALLVTSSVGVLDANTPLDTPLLVGDLLMPDHRLPDGSLCTVLMDYPDHQSMSHLAQDVRDSLRPGHLVLRGPLCSLELDKQVLEFIEDQKHQASRYVTFAYVAGPRTKTPAENRYWAQLGAQVNSMSVGPELVLANELGIPTSTLVIGHKRSRGISSQGLQDSSVTHSTSILTEDHQEMSETLKRSHLTIEGIITQFLHKAQPVESTHYIYRYE